jgi:alcohol dehydrogenase class IV
MMVPRAALLDPRLTLSCSRATTAAAGLDCITQLIEAFVCRFARPLPRALVLDALPRAIDALPRALDDPSDLAARAALSHAAFVSGMALANAGLGMAHGVAAALGIECGTPHGLACAVLLPVAVRVNRPVAGVDFARLERAVDPASSGNDSAAADAFVDRVARLCRTVGVPGRLADLGLRPDRIEWLAENSGGASMRGNPRELSVASLREILAAIA